jgi:5-methylcytosine-specific restriction endonuclease McrA
MNSDRIPTPQEQVEFLQNVQLLLQEGDFTATYKFALLIALTELSVEHGDDSGKSLDLDMIVIADKFAELYWRQTAPYTSDVPGTVADVLSQNLGPQAAVINTLDQVRRAGADNLTMARLERGWHQSLRSIARTIRNQPVQYLQNLAGSSLPFLFDYPPPRGRLVLRPGVAFNLRRFQGFVTELARAAWVRHVRTNGRNARVIGSGDDLETFMFGAERTSLAKVAPFLRDLQAGRCFYCGGNITREGEVDHFIPWSRYPRDTGHNFVLAHASCNRAKRQLLAARPHLDAWLQRTKEHGAEIRAKVQDLGFSADEGSSLSIAQWAYSQAATSLAHAWMRGSETAPIDGTYLSLFEDAYPMPTGSLARAG